MRKKLLSILALLCMTASGAWAQTSSDVGKVIAANGKMYTTVALANKVSTASGVVAYVGTAGSVETGNSTYSCLALSLNNIVNPGPREGESNLISRYCTKNADHCNGSYDYCSTLSDALANNTKYGIAATANMIANNEVTAHYHGHQAAVYGCSSDCNNVARPTGASAWSIPSLAQWNMMAKALTGCGDLTLNYDENTECTHVKLSAKFTAVGAEGFEYARYWSSTEYSSERAWTFYSNSRGVLAQDRYKDDSQSNSIHVRAMFAFASATNAYVVDYDANGGSGAPSAQSKEHGSSLTLSSTVPTRDGYTFAGWATSADGAVAYAAGATYTANADVTLYAKWTQNTATLTDGDDLSALSTWTGKTCTVTYSRSFTSGKASTVCLPFAYAPKSGETFYTFSGITKDGDNYVATMTEAATSPLTANTPYLYVKSATGDADFSGTYTIPATLEAGEATSGDWTFKGTYSTIEWTTAPATPTYGFSAQNVGEDITQGEFVKVGTYVRIKPMRAYLEYTGSDSQFKARALTRAAATDEDETLPETIKVRLIGADGTVTAIGTLHTRTGEVSFDSEAWYTLDGKRLAGQPTQKGIYVNNGKKVVIK